MSDQRQEEVDPRATSATRQVGTTQVEAATGDGLGSPGGAQRAQERVLALSRTAMGVQSLLDPGRVLETIGDELGRQGLNCVFGLLSEGGDQIVVRHANLDSDTLQAVEAMVGLPLMGFSLSADASPHLQAVVREGKTTFEKDVVRRIAEVVPSPIKEVARQASELLQARQVIVAPLVAGSEILGFLTVWSEHLAEEDVPAVSVLAQQAASAIERASLYADAMQRVFELQALRKTSLDMTRQLDLPQLLRLIVERASTFVRTTGGGLYLYHPEQRELELVVSHNLGDDYTGTRLKIGEGLSGQVVLTGEPLAVNDYSTWENRSSKFEGVRVRGILGVPLKWAGEVIGVLNLTDGESPRSFSSHDFWLLELFASHAAVAIENARLFAERERRIEQLAALHEVSLEILAETDPAHLLLMIVQKAADLLDAQAGAIDISDPETEELELTTVYGYGKERLGTRHSLGEGVVGHVAEAKKPLVVADYANWEGRSPQWEAQPIGTVLGVPLLRAGHLLGVLTIDRPVPHPFDQSDIELATLVASQAAIAIDNANQAAATKRRVAELTTLREISLQLTESLELETVLDTIVNSALRLVDASDAHIFLYDSETDQFTFGSGAWHPGQEGIPFTQVRENGLTATVARGDAPVVIDDARNHPLFRDQLDQYKVMEAIAGFPLKRANKVLGVFNIAFMDPHTFDEDELRLLTLLADQAAMAIENARLYDDLRRELTERERAEHAYRAVVDHSLQGLVIVQDFRIVFANEALADILGYASDELLAFSPDQLRAVPHPEDRDLVWGRFGDRLAGKPVPPRYELRAVRKDGDEIWLEVFSNRTEYHGRPAIQAAIVDITESKRAREALRESEERYRTLFEDSRDAVFITTREGKFLDVNESFLALFGVTKEQLDELTAADFYAHPDDRSTFQAKIEANGSVREYGFQTRKRDGTIMDTQVSATVWRAPDGTILGYRGIIRDVTERQRAQEELQRSYLALRNAFEGTVTALAALAEARDPYTAGHQVRVAELAGAIAREMGLPDDRVQGVRMAGLVHDIGKIYVPAEILSKPTDLTEIEEQMIRTHPQTAYEILQAVEFPWPVATIVLQHHERMDGSGYPGGLTEEDILLEARILAVADIVEAMASDRPYRPAHGMDEALHEVSANSGTLYFEEAVQACLKLFRERGFDLQESTSKPTA